jgi:AraC-like DNA-binding protein
MEAAHAAARAEVTPTTKQPLIWRVSRLELDDLWLVSVQESAPRLRYVELDPARTFISFPTSQRSHMIVDGAEIQMGGIIRHSPGQAFYERTHSATDWSTLSLPTCEVADLMVATAGHDTTAPRDPLGVRPTPEAIDRLIRLHAEVVGLCESAPHHLALPEVQRALRQTMIEAAAKSLEPPEVSAGTFAQRSHQIILRRFRKLLEANQWRTLYIPEVCVAIGTPERSLRACFEQHLGISPKRYLMLRRIHLARRALLRADRNCSVTNIAMRFGFWHLGRFAQVYLQVHGERPSETLARLSS